ncbi:hypothetical protein EVG20_g1351 [Dentipellis fragilis]|uniref:Chromo domain-containing protein n=1 Tax=Dentipellis fragilis TaxID=205917 RepID=A0A4Y9ZCS0_9AGAM|nr:hypothetical protein EVG20_g1351 [Dentipellis fragilis]
MAGPRNQGRSFKKSEIESLVRYIAHYNPDTKGRSGRKLYEDLVNNPKKWPWAENHTAQSWREKYVKNQEKFDADIRDYQKRKGIDPKGPPASSQLVSQKKTTSQPSQAARKARREQEEGSEDADDRGTRKVNKNGKRARESNASEKLPEVRKKRAKTEGSKQKSPEGSPKPLVLRPPAPRKQKRKPDPPTPDVKGKGKAIGIASEPEESDAEEAGPVGPEDYGGEVFSQATQPDVSPDVHKDEVLADDGISMIDLDSPPATLNAVAGPSSSPIIASSILRVASRAPTGSPQNGVRQPSTSPKLRDPDNRERNAMATADPTKTRRVVSEIFEPSPQPEEDIIDISSPSPSPKLKAPARRPSFKARQRAPSEDPFTTASTAPSTTTKRKPREPPYWSEGAFVGAYSGASGSPRFSTGGKRVSGVDSEDEWPPQRSKGKQKSASATDKPAAASPDKPQAPAKVSQKEVASAVAGPSREKKPTPRPEKPDSERIFPKHPPVAVLPTGGPAGVAPQKPVRSSPEASSSRTLLPAVQITKSHTAQRASAPAQPAARPSKTFITARASSLTPGQDPFSKEYRAGQEHRSTKGKQKATGVLDQGAHSRRQTFAGHDAPRLNLANIARQRAAHPNIKGRRTSVSRKGTFCPSPEPISADLPCKWKLRVPGHARVPERKLWNPPPDENGKYALSHIVRQDGNMYMVRWVGWGTHDDTWEDPDIFEGGSQETLNEWNELKCRIAAHAAEMRRRRKSVVSRASARRSL